MRLKTVSSKSQYSSCVARASRNSLVSECDPKEMCFNDCRDYEQKWKNSLLEDPFRYNSFSSAVTTEVIEFILQCCDTLNYSPEIEFTCLINMNRFLQKKFEKLTEIASVRFQTEQKSENDLWNEIFESIEKEIVLYILNMIMICTKFVDSTVIVPMDDFIHFLEKIHRPCATERFKTMEFLVFQLIDFKIYPATVYYSAMYFLDTCLKQMSTKPEEAYSICNDFLRLSFLRRDLIYESLDYQSVANVEQFKSDQTLLGVSVVIAVFIVLRVGVTQIELALNFIANIAHIPAKDILSLAIAIKNVITKPVNTIGTNFVATK